MPIQSDLLEITGWIGLPRPGRCWPRGRRQGPVRRGTGTTPANVLFRVPREGTRAYQNWEWCLGYTRMEQSRPMARPAAGRGGGTGSPGLGGGAEGTPRPPPETRFPPSVAGGARACRHPATGTGQQPNGPLAQLDPRYGRGPGRISRSTVSPSGTETRSGSDSKGIGTTSSRESTRGSGPGFNAFLRPAGALGGQRGEQGSGRHPQLGRPVGRPHGTGARGG